jgi:hypothetical protein
MAMRTIPGLSASLLSYINIQKHAVELGGRALAAHCVQLAVCPSVSPPH